MKNRLQTDFSKQYPTAVFDQARRTRKAEKVVAVLQDVVDHPSETTLLDIGCSTGFMTREYARTFGTAIGVDIDAEAVAFASKAHRGCGIHWVLSNSEVLPFADCSVDIVTCTHIYEHVPEPERMVSEIYRVLRPGGICFFGAGNRICLIEPHYRLPLLSIVPKVMADWYLQLLGRGEHYFESHLTYWGLRQLVRRFELIDYTFRVVEDPVRYSADDMIKPGTILQWLVKMVCRHAIWLVPTYLWILRRPQQPVRSRA